MGIMVFVKLNCGSFWTFNVPVLSVVNVTTTSIFVPKAAVTFTEVTLVKVLRFVDAVQNPAVPWVVGIGTAIAASALSVLPLISVPLLASVIVGVGVGTGVLHGTKDVKRLPGG